MFKKKGTCVIEYAQDSIRVTAVNKSVQHQAIAIVQGQEEDAAKKLASFLRQNRVARIVALSPRTSCLVATFRLPSNDHDELLKMVEFQFSRSSPYKKEDLLVDVRILEAVPPGKSLVSGAMMVRDRLTPFLEILKKAGITPDVITPNSQRLLPLAKIIWENFFIAEGKILGLWLNGTFSLSLFVKGDIYFSREESQSSGNTINAFIEYCQQEFPAITIMDGLFLGTPDQTGHKRAISGVLINVEELSNYVRTARHQAAFEQSPTAFLDLLLTGDPHAKVFDLSPVSIKTKRIRLQQKKLIVHGAVILFLLLFGLLLQTLSSFHQRTLFISVLNDAISQASVQVKGLEEKSRLVASVESYMASRLSVSAILVSLSKILPLGVHLTSFDFKDGQLNIRGEADDLDAARSFQGALQSARTFQSVRLEGIDKRPTETAQIIVFSMTMKVVR